MPQLLRFLLPPLGWNATVTSLSASTVGLVVTLYNSDGQLVDVAVKTDHASSGNYYAHAAPGNFYLKIQTTEANYTVEVQVMS